MSELIYKQDAINLVKDVCDAIMSGCDSHYDPETKDEVYNDILEVDAILKCNKEIRIALANLPSAQLEPICINLNEPIKVKLTDWGKPIGDGRPLADSEVIPRLQDIKRQIGGSYAIERAIEVLEDLLSVSPDLSTFSDKLWKIAYERRKEEGRKKGKWINNRDVSWMCSECGKWLDVLQGDVNMNFCPNCGADMR